MVHTDGMLQQQAALGVKVAKRSMNIFLQKLMQDYDSMIKECGPEIMISVLGQKEITDFQNSVASLLNKTNV